MPVNSLDTDPGEISGLAPPPPLAIADTIRDLQRDLGPRYGSFTYLNRGGFATVWRAVDETTKLPVAIKRIDRPTHSSKDFYRELRSLLLLDHEHLVRIRDFMEPSSGQRYLILEFCSGGTLRSAIDRAARDKAPACPVGRAREIGAMIAEGLQYLHARKMVHLDLKPENVLFQQSLPSAWGGSSVLKITDFGLTRVFRPKSEADSIRTRLAGSPLYMAPEQFQGEFSPASDIYALGVMLYELLHGRFLYEGTPGDIAQGHLYGKPTFDPSLPLFWAELLESMLLKDPARRPTAREIAARLAPEGVVRSPPVADSPPKIDSPLSEVKSSLLTLRCTGLSMFDIVRSGGSDGDFIAVGQEGLTILDRESGQSGRFLAMPGIVQTRNDANGLFWVLREGELTAVRPDLTIARRVALEEMPIGFAVRTSAEGHSTMALRFDGRLECVRFDGQWKPLWEQPMRSHGLRTPMLFLPDGGVVVGHGTGAARFMWVGADGSPGERVALPGICWRMESLYAGRIGAMVLQGDSFEVIRVDGDTGAVLPTQRLEDPVWIGSDRGGRLCGLSATGHLVRWDGDGQRETLADLSGEGLEFQGAAVTDTHAALLCRSEGGRRVAVLNLKS